MRFLGSVKIGDKIKFTATITEIKNDEKEESDNLSKNETSKNKLSEKLEENSKNDEKTNSAKTKEEKIEVNIEETKKEENTESKEEENSNITNIENSSNIGTKSIEVEVKIVEENKNVVSNENEDSNRVNIDKITNTNDELKKQGEEENNKSLNAGNGVDVKQSNSSNKQVETSNIQISSNQKAETTVTYNGSCNNYLNSIIIDGCTLTKEFRKDNSTYFTTVENNVNSLSINANPEDLNAKVSIYGAEELNEGINKVLISVTAENGNVRTYRIYINKNS